LTSIAHLLSPRTYIERVQRTHLDLDEALDLIDTGGHSAFEYDEPTERELSEALNCAGYGGSRRVTAMQVHRCAVRRHGAPRARALETAIRQSGELPWWIVDFVRHAVATGHLDGLRRDAAAFYGAARAWSLSIPDPDVSQESLIAEVPEDPDAELLDAIAELLDALTDLDPAGRAVFVARLRYLAIRPLGPVPPLPQRTRFRVFHRRACHRSRRADPVPPPAACAQEYRRLNHTEALAT